MDAEMESVLAYARDAKAPNTKRAYQSDWNAFAAFCTARNQVSLPAPADVVALYLRHAAEKQRLKMSTVTRRIAAITEKHRSNGFVSPSDEWVVRNTLRRLRRELGTPAQGKAPLLTTDLQKVMQLIPATLTGSRDKAVLLLGFAGAMRRSELVGLNVADLALAPEGLVQSVNKDKTDQLHQGRKIGIPNGKDESTCPVRAVLRWLEESRIMDGPPISRREPAWACRFHASHGSDRCRYREEIRPRDREVFVQVQRAFATGGIHHERRHGGTVRAIHSGTVWPQESAGAAGLPP